MNAKVSVIVPVYNSQNYLERCLDTLVNQTLDDLEIVVVNDGSTDDSQAIIDGYSERYPSRIVALTKSNGGLSDARNFGMEHASGEYIGFVDSDDWVDLDMYERMYTRANDTDSDVVCTPINYVSDTVQKKNYYTRVLDRFGGPARENPRVLIWANSYAWNKIYRTSFLKENTFAFPLGQFFEDSAVIYNLLDHANRIEYVNVPFYHYVQDREDSITKTLDNRLYDIFLSCESILDYYENVPHAADMKVTAEYLCIKHILMRFNLLARSDDREFIRKFLDAAFDFLDARIPDWQQNFYFKRGRLAGLTTTAVRYLRSRPSLAKVYYTSPRLLRFVPREARRALRTARTTLLPRLRPKQVAENARAIDRVKAARIQGYGYQFLAVVQTLLREKAGVKSFADFGTLLGLVREGALLKHDIDLDIGVILNEPADALRVRIAMERFGFKVWREYFLGDELVESSYRLFGIKVDLNYYRVDDTGAKTWLFYRDPDKKYGPRDRDVVEMRYSPIGDLVPLTVDGCDVWIPANAEQLLVEKYGPTWRVPDRNWLYWESPAATRLEGITGRFTTFRYIGGFQRSGDPGNAEVYERLYRHEISDRHQVDPEMAEIRQLQQLELTILHEVDRVCRALGITYYLAEGTLLGAIRHGGFIPWDDDIDISMPREDYERFLVEAPNVIGSTFAVQHWTLTPKYWSTFAKVRLLDNSVFYQLPIAHLTPDNGPYIDIFPIDSVPAAQSEVQRRQKELMTRYRKALSYKRGDTRPKTTQTKILRAQTVFESIPGLYAKIDEMYRLLEDSDNEYWVNLASYYAADRETFPKGYYGEPRYVTFEDGTFPVPAQAEAILEQIYGPSYMDLPEIDQRKVKHAMVYRGGTSSS